MKKLHSIKVKGHKHNWSFETMLDTKYTKDWESDGLDIVQIENTVPGIIAKLRLVKAYCFIQDVFNFRNPWR